MVWAFGWAWVSQQTSVRLSNKYDISYWASGVVSVDDAAVVEYI